MIEQEFSNALRLALTEARIGVTLYRQQSGKVRTDKGTWMELAPTGASDLVGCVAPEGWMLQVEIKGPRTRTTAEQAHWRARWAALGAIALEIRHDPRVSPAASVAAGVESIRAAIHDRRHRP